MRRWLFLAGLLGLAGCALDEPVQGSGHYGQTQSYGYSAPYDRYYNNGYARPRVYSRPSRAYVERPPVVVGPRHDGREGRGGSDRRHAERQHERREHSGPPRGALRQDDHEAPRVLDRRSPADRGDLGG
jgi:hypothetical protein